MTAATHHIVWLAKPGEGSRSGLKQERGRLPKHVKTGPGGVSRRERLSSNSYGVSRRERLSSSGHEGGDSKWRGIQRVRKGIWNMEHKHGKALPTLWPSTAAKEVPGHDGSLYHWILTSVAKRVASSLCTGPPTKNFFSAQVYLQCALSKALQRWLSGRSSRWH